jgi:hypothetical protein
LRNILEICQPVGFTEFDYCKRIRKEQIIGVQQSDAPLSEEISSIDISYEPITAGPIIDKERPTFVPALNFSILSYPIPNNSKKQYDARNLTCIENTPVCSGENGMDESGHYNQYPSGTEEDWKAFILAQQAK